MTGNLKIMGLKDYFKRRAAEIAEENKEKNIKRMAELSKTVSEYQAELEAGEEKAAIRRDLEGWD